MTDVEILARVSQGAEDLLTRTDQDRLVQIVHDKAAAHGLRTIINKFTVLTKAGRMESVVVVYDADAPEAFVMTLPEALEMPSVGAEVRRLFEC